MPDEADDSKNAFTVRLTAEGENFLAVQARGDLDLATLSAFLDGLRLLAMQPEDQRALILDFTELDYIDSTGLGSLLKTYWRMKEKRRVLRIAAPRRNVLRAIGLLQFDTIIPIYQSVQEAIEACNR